MRTVWEWLRLVALALHLGAIEWVRALIEYALVATLAEIVRPHAVALIVVEA